MKALYIASTGMAAQEQNVEIISNNIANMRTTGYKRQRAEFQDLLYQQYQRAGSATSDQGTSVAGRHRGRLGREDRRDAARHEPGHRRSDRERPRSGGAAAKATSPSTCPTAAPAIPATARSTAAPDGLLVNVDGYQVQPGITIPDNANSISISADGIVQAYVGTATTPTQLGQIQLYRFVNPTGLEAVGDNNFVETAASGTAQAGTPNADGMGQPDAGLPRAGQRQSGDRDRRPDRRAARLRNECPRRHRRRRDALDPISQMR